MQPVSKSVLMIVPVSKTAAASATGNVDTAGFDFATIDVALSAADATTTKPGTLKILECDTTVATSFANVTALVGDGTGGFTIANGDTTGSIVLKANIDLKARKRYLRAEVSPSTTQMVCVIANLHRKGGGGAVDSSATFAGADAVANV